MPTGGLWQPPTAPLRCCLLHAEAFPWCKGHLHTLPPPTSSGHLSGIDRTVTLCGDLFCLPYKAACQAVGALADGWSPLARPVGDSKEPFVPS